MEQIYNDNGPHLSENGGKYMLQPLEFLKRGNLVLKAFAGRFLQQKRAYFLIAGLEYKICGM